MIGKILCWLGLHDWVTVARGDDGDSAPIIMKQCSRCPAIKRFWRE